MRHRWLPPSVAAGAAFGSFMVILRYPWFLALLASTAIGALVYSAQGTWERLRGLYAQPDMPGANRDEDVQAQETD